MDSKHYCFLFLLSLDLLSSSVNVYRPRIRAAHGQSQIWLTCDVTVNFWIWSVGQAEKTLKFHAVLYMYMNALIKITKLKRSSFIFRSVNKRLVVLHFVKRNSISLLPFPAFFYWAFYAVSAAQIATRWNDYRSVPGFYLQKFEAVPYMSQLQSEERRGNRRC